MRSSQLLEKLSRTSWYIKHSRNSWEASRAYGAATGAEAEASGSQEGPIFAACVLQRLPLLKPPLSPQEVKHQTWVRQRGLETGDLKDYPEGATKGRGDTGSKQEKQDLRTFSPVPSETAADASGDARSMRRRLTEALYLVVRSRGGPQVQSQRGTQPQAQPANASREQQQGTRSPGPGAGAGTTSPVSPTADAGRDAVETWVFPWAANAGEESISDTAQRALHSAIGRSHPVFFVGRAPMAHLNAPRPSGKTFFMLAQAVDDPWDIRLVEGGPAQDYAWVTKQELLGSYLTDARLRELVTKML